MSDLEGTSRGRSLAYPSHRPQQIPLHGFVLCLRTTLYLGVREDVPELLVVAHALTLPSCHETMPVVAAKALCAGRRVVGTDAVGLRWLSNVLPAGVVPLDAEAWTAAIEEVAASPLDEETAATATARFRSERGVAGYVEAYDAALVRGPLLRRLRRPARGPEVAS